MKHVLIMTAINNQDGGMSVNSIVLDSKKLCREAGEEWIETVDRYTYIDVSIVVMPADDSAEITVDKLKVVRMFTETNLYRSKIALIDAKGDVDKAIGSLIRARS